MSDLISRQAAIDAIENRLAEPAYQHTGEDWYVGMNCAESELYELPSAQPEKDDTISRQAAIDAIMGQPPEPHYPSWYAAQIEKLPSAQPELYKDEVSRQAAEHLDLFAKAYCRDKSVTNDLAFRCEQCDFEMPDEKCLIKTMARKLCPDYKNFGCMGDL